MINKSENNFQISKILEIPEITTIVVDIIEDKQGSIWISSAYDGIFNISFQNDDFKDYDIKQYLSVNGLPSDANNKVNVVDEKLIFTTKKGIYKVVDNGDSLSFVPDSFFGDLFTKDTNYVAQIFKYKNSFLINTELLKVGLLTINNDSISRDNKLSKRFPNYYRVDLQDEDNLYLYTSDGLFHYDLRAEKDKSINYNCLIRRVYLKNDSILFNGSYYLDSLNTDSVNCLLSDYQPNYLIPHLEYKYNSLTFEFSAAFYEDNGKTRYSYMIEGFEDEWSILTFETKAIYTNIPEGKYTFKVKATNIYGDESTVAEFKFVISPPWYRTIAAYITYFVLAVLFIYLIIKIQTKRLKQQNIELERIVKERTAEIQHQKEEIEAQAHELEKLSIVASETDNAVVIADSNGDFEWINHGFTRLYGYNFEEMIKLFGKNLLTSSSNPQIQELLDHCLKERTTVIYESTTKTKDGRIKWAQTTITPIVNKNGEVTKLIAIDSDISKLKQAEMEILQKNEEIMLQKEMLEQQNEEITTQNEELELQNSQIAFQNEQIKSSIRYAKTIQTAILPTGNLISNYFEHFIIYRPKDIVSGDFYWFSVNKYSEGEYYFIAAIDCTGHGVPGAFMSMIANRIVSEIINEAGIFSPKEILQLLDKNIRKALKQDENFNQDGMDLCLCRIEKKSGNEFEIVFSGAKRALYYFNSQKKSLETLKADRKSIGGTNLRYSKVEFTNQNLKMFKNDILYLSTDGYIDQNDVERKKIGTTKFLQTLEYCLEQPLIEQKIVLTSLLGEWQKESEQRDDITLIGLKL